MEIQDTVELDLAASWPGWRPAAPWAAFFAASRHEALEGLLATEEASVDLAEPATAAESRPPEGWAAEPWPPRRVRVERPRAPGAATSLRRRIGRIFPDLSEAQETRVPLALVGGGLGVVLLVALLLGGPRGLLASLVWDGLALAVSVTTGLAGCWIAARIAGIDFGYVRTAAVKLAAVFTVPLAIDVLISALLGSALPGGLAYLALCFWLLAWLFDLDVLEVGITVLVTFLLRIVLWLVVWGLLLD